MNGQPQGEIRILTEADIVGARRIVRQVSSEAGFGLTDVTRIVTAASELARNVFRYAGAGVLRWQTVRANGGIGVEFVFEDSGPGIADLSEAMQEGFTTSGGLGLGLPGAKRLMDEFDIQSQPGEGTTVKIRKWKKT
jgi:serine/threonine-protein kinase RsbT